MASLEQLPSGRWRINYRHQGKQGHSPAFDTVEEARGWAAIYAGDQAKGHRYDPALPRTRFRVYAEGWLALRPTGPNHGAARSKERWALNTLYPRFGEVELGAIHRTHVQDWVNRSSLAPSSVRSVYAVLASILRTAAADGYLPAGTPVGRGLIRLPALDTEPSWMILTHEQLDHLLAVCRERHPVTFPVVRLLADTGMRQGEAFALHRTDYSPLGGWVDVTTGLKRMGGRYVEGTRTKTGKRRRVALYPETVEALNAQLAAHTFDLIFPGRGGTARDISAWRNRRWNQLVADAGMPDLDPHDLRHTHVTHLLDAGVDPSVVAERLGHSKKMVLDTYGHVLPGRQQEAIQLLRRRDGG